MFSTMPCACVILLFLLGMHLCSSQSPEQHVKGTVGQNFLFQTSVSGSGNLIRGVSTLAKVTGGALVFSDNSGRVSWDKQTGFFQIKDLKTSDGEIYTVEIPNGQSAKYILVVYHPVSLPQVRVISRGGTCFLECSVKNGREVTLLLKSSGKTLIHTVDPDLNTRLVLHRVTEGLSHSYSCVASNPVSNESVPVQPDQFCGGPQEVELTEGDSFSFQASVRQEGSLTHRDLGRIAEVSAGKMSPVRVESFRDRVTWNRTTGLFGISKLEMGDSGEYTVEVKDEGRIKFLLTIQKGKRLPTWAAILIAFLAIALVAALGGLLWIKYKSGKNKDPEGESFIVPFPVKRNGEFRHSDHGLIATVSNGQISTEEKYKNRVTWDSRTGLLTIQHREKGDAGVFTVKDKDTKKNSKMHLPIMILEELPEGESFTVPFPVKRNGEFRHSDHGLIATVSNGQISTEEMYKNRVTLESCTGLLTIRHLEKGDAGVFTVKDKDTKNNSKIYLSIMSDDSECQNVTSSRSSSHSPEKENLLPGEVAIAMDDLRKTSGVDNSVL